MDMDSIGSDSGVQKYNLKFVYYCTLFLFQVLILAGVVK